jgi:hypothetical protein
MFSTSQLFAGFNDLPKYELPPNKLLSGANISSLDSVAFVGS